MKKRVQTLMLLVIFLFVGVGVCIFLKSAFVSIYRKALIEGVIRQLRQEIVFEDQDVLTFRNGYLEAIDIKTEETAEMLFACIRNCVQITDLTNADLEPTELPIEINGQGMGTFYMFFVTYQKTGRFYCISFAPEDTERFYQYVMELADALLQE